MATVYYRRKVLAAELARNLRKSFVVVPNPDHPFLLRAADILIGGDNELISIFFPSASEARDSSKLRARLILNKLALPPQVRSVLVFDPLHEEIAEKFNRDFESIISWPSRDNLLNVLQTKKDRRVPPEMLLYAQKRFANAMTLTSIMRRLSRDDPNKVEITSSAFQRRARMSIDRIDDVEVARFTGGRFDATSALALINNNTNREIGLDNGIPYFYKFETSLAIVDGWPPYQSDPDKLLRASGFAGWSFLTDDQNELLGRATEFIRKRSRQ
jgi:hypothetical protein